MWSHGEDQVVIGHDLRVYLSGAVAPNIERSLHADEERGVGCRRAFPCRGAGATDDDVIEPALPGDTPRDRRGEGAAAGVAGADAAKLHVQSSFYASPMRSVTLSRSAAAAMGRGRITRARRLVQSTTVEGAEGVRRPASSTRRRPRAMTSL